MGNWQTRTDIQTLVESLTKGLSIDGDIAECGVAEGETALILLQTLKESNINKTIHLFDTFSGQPNLFTDWEAPHIDRNMFVGADNYSIQRVTQTLSQFDNFRFYPGLFSEILPEFHKDLCFIHADADQYQSTLDIIEFVHKNLSIGGYVVFHDYGHVQWVGVKKAIDETFNFNDFEYDVFRTQFVAKRLK